MNGSFGGDGRNDDSSTRRSPQSAQDAVPTAGAPSLRAKTLRTYPHSGHDPEATPEEQFRQWLALLMQQQRN